MGDCVTAPIRGGGSATWALARAALVLAIFFTLSAPAFAAAKPAPGTVERLTYGTGSTAHPYLVYTPRGYKPSQRLPLIVMVHGCQTTAYQQMEANLYNPLADRKHFVVAYPDTNALEAAQPGPLKNCWQYWEPADGSEARTMAPPSQASPVR